MSRKRKIDEVEENVLSENKRLKTWVSATETRNYILNDGLVDIIKKRNCPVNESKFITFIKDMGHKFESKVVEYLNDMFYEVTKICDSYINKDEYIIQLMKKGAPILYQVPLHNSEDNTYGIADLIVRSDVLNNIILNKPLTRNEKRKGSAISKNWHYVVIDIKYCTIYLRSDGEHILNTRHFPAYKSQLLIYNRALSKLQGYNSPYAFILGRGWRYQKEKVVYQGNGFERLGKINYDTVDSSYLEKTNKAVNWAKMVKQGSEQNKCNDKDPNLYPNMKLRDDCYEYKKIYSEYLNDITQIWQCGIKNREKAFSNNIYGWKDKKCKAELIGVPKSRQLIVDKIININRSEDDLVLPHKIKSNFMNWKSKHPSEYFIDFETISDIFDDFSCFPYKKCIPNKVMIYMIGVGWIKDDKWFHKTFTIKSLKKKDEINLFFEFLDFLPKQSTLIHWSPAETRLFSDIKGKYKSIRKKNKGKGLRWLDLCQLFKEEPIVIKDCFSFGLKDISSSLYSHGIISSNWIGENNAMDCSLLAWNYYNKHKGSLDSIISYNETDCKVMYEIMTYLRNNHT